MCSESTVYILISLLLSLSVTLTACVRIELVCELLSNKVSILLWAYSI